MDPFLCFEFNSALFRLHVPLINVNATFFCFPLRCSILLKMSARTDFHRFFFSGRARRTDEKHDRFYAALHRSIRSWFEINE